MSITPNEAAASLKEIERTGRRSASVRVYATSSPFLMMWGVIWMIGYGVSDLAPHYADRVWIALLIAGVGGSALIGRIRAQAGNHHPGLNRHAGLRFLACYMAFIVFVASTYALFGGARPEVQAAFIPMVVALSYTVWGIWIGVRFLVTGIVVAALTMGGFFFLHDHFLLWMAFVGGGSLVLAGLWLKKV
ncbi:MAG TPA: hypothetical protein VGM26_12305 [Rhizomicrobium sp.]|jgi:hypothetical protein